jgi:hypothetical protein
MFQKKTTPTRRNHDRSGEILRTRRFSDASVRRLPPIRNMKHLLVGAFAVLSLLACGSEVIVDSEPSGDGGGGGTSATTGSSTTTEPLANGCSMSCTDKGESTCSCVRTCTGSALGGQITKAVCKPIPSGIIECVCTLDSGSFSGTCYEKKNAACDFDFGCCANYFSGK